MGDNNFDKGFDDSGFENFHNFMRNFSVPSEEKKPEPSALENVYRDWDPHVSESSGEKFFINLINQMCSGLRKRGLVVSLLEHDASSAKIKVEWDRPVRPGTREPNGVFCLRNEDNQNYSWKRTTVDPFDSFYESYQSRRGPF